AAVEIVPAHALQPVVRAQPEVAGRVLEDAADEPVDDSLLRAERGESPVLEPAQAAVRGAHPEGALGIETEAADGLARQAVGAAVEARGPVCDMDEAALLEATPDAAVAIAGEGAGGAGRALARLEERLGAGGAHAQQPVAVADEHLAPVAAGQQREDGRGLLPDKWRAHEPAR